MGRWPGSIHLKVARDLEDKKGQVYTEAVLICSHTSLCLALTHQEEHWSQGPLRAAPPQTRTSGHIYTHQVGSTRNVRLHSHGVRNTRNPISPRLLAPAANISKAHIGVLQGPRCAGRPTSLWRKHFFSLASPSSRCLGAAISCCHYIFGGGSVDPPPMALLASLPDLWGLSLGPGLAAGRAAVVEYDGSGAVEEVFGEEACPDPLFLCQSGISKVHAGEVSDALQGINHHCPQPIKEPFPPAGFPGHRFCVHHMPHD